MAHSLDQNRKEIVLAKTFRRLSVRMGLERTMRRMWRLLQGRTINDIDKLAADVEKAMKDPEAAPGPETDPMWQAQELLWSAYEVDDPEEAARLAREALAIYPDSADAYIILARQAESLGKSIQLLEQGVAAGERALGPAPFEGEKAQFWKDLQTHPYIRARYVLAHALWAAGRAEEAVVHLQAVLELDEKNSLGARDSLVNWLLALGRIDEAERLLLALDEAGCRWAYSKVLCAYLKEGDSVRARRLFNEAFASNVHVVHLLLNLVTDMLEGPEKESIRASLPQVDDKSAAHVEAFSYVLEGADAWLRTPETTSWLVEQIKRAARYLQAIQEPSPSGGRKIGRNGPCPCGSGRKHKQCCLGIV